MRVVVVGTGTVGRTIAAQLAQGGHDVVVATRSPDDTRAREEWHGSTLQLVALPGASEGAELVINATNGDATIAALEGLGSELDGVVLLDISNPLDFSEGFPPKLSVANTDSLAEQVQRRFPQARVVKALNMMTASGMLDPVPGTTAMVAGDDPAARATVVSLLRSYGWDDVIEFDSLEPARGMEMWVHLWVRVMSKLGTADFNLAIVRRETTV